MSTIIQRHPSEPGYIGISNWRDLTFFLINGFCGPDQQDYSGWYILVFWIGQVGRNIIQWLILIDSFINYWISIQSFNYYYLNLVWLIQWFGNLINHYFLSFQTTVPKSPESATERCQDKSDSVHQPVIQFNSMAIGRNSNSAPQQQ